ncbi:ATP-dependent DNA helicase RecG [Sphingomonas sp.]|uniref:ATP-dependent DNA helicase RecG n=1 Tax=Sphingomonas sp. TaxID=28214 RepID=UPI0025E99F9A|nr:ATP-dependent DNA helicase RecG [Sphingomonas sp.]
MRPELLNPLFAEVEALKGVGAGIAKPLARLGLERVVDVLFHLSTGTVTRTRLDRLDDGVPGDHVAIVVTPIEYRQNGSRGPLRVQAVDLAGDYLSLTYFGARTGYARKLLPLGEPKLISGKLELYGQERQIVHPDQILAPDDQIALREAIYPLSEGLTARRLGQLAEQAIGRAPELPEWIEPGLLAAKGWPGWRVGIATAHHTPDDALARERIAYDEVFANQLALMLVRASSRKRRGTPLTGDGRHRDALRLPYAPTGAQRRVMAEIEGDMAQPTPMVRLLQGDVGSGKTLVALEAMLIAVEAGAQAALLAPTEILARQHFANLQAMMSGLPVRIAILTGRDKGRVREATLMGLADGSIDMLIGTHAIFQEAVAYKKLGLAVVDEQHRFGVAQRMLLTAKAERPPHLLVMTATPIPRTLTLTNYGEMDVSRIDEMPPGRTPVETSVVAGDRLDEVIAGLGRHIEGGGQAFWVCPLVEESEIADRSAAEARAAALRSRFGDRIGLVHGRMKGPDKDAVMLAFQQGALSVLVATTVIEVGVDVPNASLIVIEDAERFGLAQLHQLRGRVGRGAERSVCLLLRGNSLSETARARLATMKNSTDGFFIAEEDLRLRGAGELLGTRQSGEARFRLATAEQIVALTPTAHDDARLLVDRDGGLDGDRGRAARLALYLFERDAGVALLRSG